MKKELKSLIKYLNENNNPAYFKIKKLAMDYHTSSRDLDLKNQFIQIDIDELKSLIDPSKSVDTQEIGLFTLPK